MRGKLSERLRKRLRAADLCFSPALFHEGDIADVRALESAIAGMREAALRLNGDLGRTAFRDRNNNNASDLDSFRELLRMSDPMTPESK